MLSVGQRTLASAGRSALGAAVRVAHDATPELASHANGSARPGAQIHPRGHYHCPRPSIPGTDGHQRCAYLYGDPPTGPHNRK